MAEIVNPYIAGAPVTEQRMFFGRDDIFQWIENSIAGQYADHILVVHGQRRVGKTSVLKQLGNRLPKRYIPVFFDLQGRTHTTLNHFLWWLARETVRVLKQERGIEVPPPEKQAFASDPEYFENQFLSGLRSALGNNTLLLTFDEFDNLEENEVKEELARPLVDHLRRLMGQPNLNFVFSIGSSGRKLENMQAAYTDFFKTALYKKISFLNEEQTHKLVTRPVEGIIEYERAAVDRIFHITSGHPYFTQLTCHELFARCQRTEQRKIAIADVEAILDDVVERGTVNLKFVWDEASDIEKWSLSALAQLEKTDSRAVADYLRKNRVRFSETDLTSGLLHLREKDVLTPQNRFVIHLLRIWLQKNRPIEQAREELTEANPIASRFIEIGLEFRDGGQHEKAIEFFRQALSVASDNLQAQVNIALTYASQGQLEQAIAEFEKALTIDDEDVASRSGLCDAHLKLGDAALQKGRAKEAVLSYQRVLAINAEHLEARGRMAELSRQRAEKALTDGKDEEALSAFAEALKFTPEDGSLIARSEKVRAEKNAKVLAEQISRSEKEANARNWDKAIAALNAALEIAPGDESILKRIEGIQQSQLRERLDAILSKVDAAEKAERWEAAIGGLNEYLQWKPEDTAIQKRIADLVEAKHAAWLKGVMARVERAASAQNWDEALSALNEALRLEPDNAEMQARAAQVREMRRVAELNARLQRADQAAGAGRWDEAINILNDGLASDPENKTLKTKLAEARKAKREAHLQAALRLADTAAQAGKWESAIEALNEVLAIEPENAEFQKKLSEVRALERSSKLTAARTQARGHARAEPFDESLKAWDEYIKLDPDDRQTAQAEIESVKKAQTLARNYAEAYKAYSKSNYEKAIGLFKTIVMEDAEYKDASRLLAESVELRRTARKWWQSKWVLGGVLGVVVLIVGWLAFRYGAPLLTALQTAPTSETSLTGIPVSTVPPTMLAATDPPTATAAPLPYTWARVNSGQFLPKDSINSIIIDPTDAGVMYIGTNSAGAYKSIDGGISWQPIQNGLGYAAIWKMVISPSNPEVIYASTSFGGVFKTTDRGSTWQASNNGIDVLISAIMRTPLLIDSKNDQHLFFTQQYSIFESNDAGETWEKVNQSQCPNLFDALVLHPQNSQILFATGDGESCEGGTYQSQDGGSTWEFKGQSSSGRLFINPDGSRLFAGGGGATAMSSDEGITWEVNLNEHCAAFEFVPGQEQIAYCGTFSGTIERSHDGGTNWERLYSTPDGSQVRAITLSADNPNTIWAGGNNLLYSNDAGKTWVPHNSGLGGGPFHLTTDPFEPTILYAEVSINNSISWIYRSPDQGKTWNLIENSENVSGLSVGSSAGILIRFLDDQNILLSKDRGDTWEIMGASDLPDYYQSSAIEYRNGDNGLEVTTDSGFSWELCGLPESTTESRTSFLVWATASDSKDNSRLFIGTEGYGIFESTDSCKSWMPHNSGLGSLVANSIAIDPNYPDTIYAGTDGGAYVSFNGGQTWGQVNDGLLGATVVYSIVVDKDSNVYAATPYGIFKLEGK